VRRVLAIRALKAFPLAVNVSVAEREVLAAWRRQTWIFSLVALGACTVIVGLLLLLAQRSREVESLVRPKFALFLAQLIEIVCTTGVGLSTQ
jgi:hypothetical protein